jgi:hypothetical protein
MNPEIINDVSTPSQYFYRRFGTFFGHGLNASTFPAQLIFTV